MPLAGFHPTIQRWFEQRFGEPTEPQREGWPRIRAGGHTLISAPTGTGKTIAAYLSAIAASGRNPFGYVFNYHNRTRGMSFHHDIHDWLGGYPYESASPEEIVGFMNKHGLSLQRSFQRPAAVKGLFGSHCDEYVARRAPTAPA